MERVHKFPVLKDGVNGPMVEEVRAKVNTWLREFFDEDDLVRVEDLVAFCFGSATIQVTVLPWHSGDVLVKVFSYLAENVDKNKVAADFLRLNADLPLGAFSLVFDNTVMLSCSLPGANLDKSELLGAVQTVAAYADQYDDILKELYM